MVGVFLSMWISSGLRDQLLNLTLSLVWLLCFSDVGVGESTDVDKVPLLCMHWQAYNLSGQWFCCLSQKWKSAGCTINWNKTRVVGVSNLPAGLSVFTPAYFRVRFYPILRALIMYFLYFSSWKTLQDLSENYILQFKILLKILLNI